MGKTDTSWRAVFRRPGRADLREAIAKNILEAANRGERDLVRLREAGLAATGKALRE